MSYTLVDIISFSVLIAVIISCIRFRDISATWYPFLLLIWAGLLNETVSFILIRTGHHNVVSFNLFTLTEAVLITWQFYEWKLFREKRIFHAFLAAYILFWTGENFVFGTIHAFCSYYIIFYSFLLVIMSINQVNRLITNPQETLLKNPVFLICMGLILFFTYSVIVETFIKFGLGPQFSNNIYGILIYINLFVNLLFAIAVLWIPRKQKFLLQS